MDHNHQNLTHFQPNFGHNFGHLQRNFGHKFGHRQHNCDYFGRKFVDFLFDLRVFLNNRVVPRVYNSNIGPKIC